MQEFFDFLERVVSTVAILSWQGTLLTILVALGLLVSGRWLSARVRYVAWGVIVVRLLLFVSVPSAFSLYRIPELASPGNWIASSSEENRDLDLHSEEPLLPEKEAVTTTMMEPAAIEFPVPEPSPVTLEPVVETSQIEPATVSTPTPMNLKSIEPVSPDSHEPSKVPSANPLWTWLCITWAVGAIVVVLRMGITWCAIRKQLRQSCQAPSELSNSVAEFARASGLRRSVRVRITSNNLGPAINGLFRPVMYLPDWMLSELSTADVRLAVQHELAHVRRGDVLVLWLSAIVRVLHWFNPCVRWALARLSRECELACDESVLRDLSLDERHRYGDVLLSVVERSTWPAPSPALLGFSRSAWHLKRRIEMIGSYRRPNRPVATLAFVVICGLAVAGLTSAESRQTDSAPAVNEPEQLESSASESASETSNRTRVG